MFRAMESLVSVVRALGIVLVVCGLGMVLTSPAVADDPGDDGEAGQPLICELCVQPCTGLNACWCVGEGYCQITLANPPCYCLR